MGIDFSANAIGAARELASASGLESSTEWLVSDAYEAVAAVRGRSFDIVYTGFGALCWLPDIPRWAAVMNDLCRPRGRLVLNEFHPLSDVLGDEEPVLARDYFQSGGEVFDEPGSYASDGMDTEANLIVDFIHSIGEVMTSLLGEGFVIRAFREYDFTLFERWPWLEEDEGGVFHLPADVPKIPLMYSLVADKPA